MKHFISLLLGFLSIVFNVFSYDWTPKNLSNYQIAFEVTDGDTKAPFVRLEPNTMGQPVSSATCSPRVEVSYIDKQGSLTPVWNESMLKPPTTICNFANKVISFKPVDPQNPQGSWYAS